MTGVQTCALPIWLKELRLDVPQVTLLAHELKKEGIPIPDGILTKEELREALDVYRQNFA